MIVVVIALAWCVGVVVIKLAEPDHGHSPAGDDNHDSGGGGVLLKTSGIVVN